MVPTLVILRDLVQKKVAIEWTVESLRSYLNAPPERIKTGREFDEEVRMYQNATNSYVFHTNVLVRLRCRLDAILSPSETPETRTAVETLSEMVMKKMIYMDEARIAISHITKKRLSIGEYIASKTDKPRLLWSKIQQESFLHISEPSRMDLRVYAWKSIHPHHMWSDGDNHLFKVDEIDEYIDVEN